MKKISVFDMIDSWLSFNLKCIAEFMLLFFSGKLHQ